MDYDTFLSHFGTFGWFNLVLIFITCLAGASTMSMNSILINFLGTRRDHWCFMPELANRSFEDQLRLGIPWDASTNAYATCSMYAQPLADVDADVNVTWAPEMPQDVACQYGMAYDTSVRSSTFISEWGLVCDDAWMTDFVSPIFIAGQFIGGLLCGSISNKLGRKRSLALMLMCNVAACVAATFSVNLYMFVAARFLVAACGVNCLSLGYVLALEITPTKYREVAGITCSVMYDVGILIACGMASTLTDWRALQLAAALFCVPCVVLLMIIVPESPRWLTWQDRRQEAADALARIARFNRAAPSADILQEFCGNKKSDDTPEPGPATNGTYREIFVNPVTRRCVLTISFAWVTTTFMFSAVSYNVDKLFGDIYVNATVLALVAIGANLVTALAIHFGGRRVSLMVVLLSAILVGIVGAVGQTLEGWELVVTMSAIFIRGIGSSGNTIGYVVILELFPTPIRNLVLGLATAASYGTAMAAPFVAGTLTEVWQPVSYVVYICMAAIALVLVSWLPESRGQRMPETIGELEALKSPKKDLFQKNLQTSVQTLPDVTKEKGYDNLAFHGCMDYPPDVPGVPMDNGILKISPQSGPNCTAAHNTAEGVFIIDEHLQKGDQTSKIPSIIGSSPDLSTADDKDLKVHLPEHIQGHIIASGPLSIPTQCVPMSTPNFGRRFSLPLCSHSLQRHMSPRPSIIAEGESTAPLYLSLLDQVVVTGVEHDTYITKM